MTVEARAADGEIVVGRTALALVNPAYEALAQKKIIALMISLHPRFPEIGVVVTLGIDGLGSQRHNIVTA